MSRWWRPVLALLLVTLFLGLPGRWSMAGPALPIELAAMLLILVLMPWRGWPWLGAGLIGATVVLKLANLAAWQVMARAFNPFLDLQLLAPGWEVLAASTGGGGAVALLLLVVLMIVLMFVLLHWSLVTLARSSSLPAVGLSVAAAVIVLSTNGMVTAETSRLVLAQVEATQQAIDDAARFEQDMASDLCHEVPDDRLLSGLAGRDVLLVFVESYGRAALDHPWYSARIGQSLARFEETLAEKGFAARSAFLVSPTFGGQSWLAHDTLLSGLRIDSQSRHQALMASDRGTLTRDFARAGWRTVAVMPAITRAWPEAALFAWDRIYGADDLDYRGLAFDWVTMPDQFTLEAFDRLERRGTRHRPVMATIALLSSHLPWTPLPELLPWDVVGDGRIFDRFVREGEVPDVVWRDPDRVREHYARSIDYSLATLASYIATRGDRDLVVIVLGDHEPISLVSGDGGGHQVPVHVVAGDPQVLTAIDSWGFQPGMKPGGSAPVWPMENLRARLLAAFTPAPGVAGGLPAAPR